MGRGLRPPRSVASRVERAPAARPLLSIGRASGPTSGSALELYSVRRGGGGAKFLSPCYVPSGLTISSVVNREQSGAWALLCFPHSPIFPSQLPPCRLIETLSGVASLQVNTAVLSAQATRSFEVWDGTRPPSVGGTLPYSPFSFICR